MRRWLALALLAAGAPSWADMTTDQAFEAGRVFGLSPQGAAAVKGAISGTTAADKVPQYRTSNVNSTYFAGGDGDPRTPGGARVTECAGAAYPDPRQQAECDAINDLANNRAARPAFAIGPDDPILVKGRAIKGDPASVAQGFGGAYGDCTVKTTNTPPIFETEVCNEFSVAEPASCTMGQEVVIDPDYVYKCLETIQSQADRTCTVGRVVQVDTDYNYRCQANVGSLVTNNCQKILNVTVTQVGTCIHGGVLWGNNLGMGCERQSGHDYWWTGSSRYPWMQITCDMSHPGSIAIQGAASCSEGQYGAGGCGGSMFPDINLMPKYYVPATSTPAGQLINTGMPISLGRGSGRLYAGLNCSNGRCDIGFWVVAGSAPQIPIPTTPSIKGNPGSPIPPGYAATAVTVAGTVPSITKNWDNQCAGYEALSR